MLFRSRCVHLSVCLQETVPVVYTCLSVCKKQSQMCTPVCLSARNSPSRVRLSVCLQETVLDVYTCLSVCKKQSQLCTPVCLPARNSPIVSVVFFTMIPESLPLYHESVMTVSCSHFLVMLLTNKCIPRQTA